MPLSPPKLKSINKKWGVRIARGIARWKDDCVVEGLTDGVLKVDEKRIIWLSPALGAIVPFNGIFKIEVL